jgi:hypothetical protein
MTTTDTDWHYFTSSTGMRLPLKLVGPLEKDALGHRNTYIRAGLDHQARLVRIEKMVYGETQLIHRYEYAPSGRLARAEIVMDDETTIMIFDEDGTAVRD